MLSTIEIINPHGLSLEYIQREVEQCERQKNRVVRKAEFLDNGDGTSTQRFWFSPVGFNRVRRITGYLVGDMARFNQGKLSEVLDRVPHTV